MKQEGVKMGCPGPWSVTSIGEGTSNTLVPSTRKPKSSSSQSAIVFRRSGPKSLRRKSNEFRHAHPPYAVYSGFRLYLGLRVQGLGPGLIEFREAYRVQG